PLASLSFPAIFSNRNAMERVRAQILCLRVLNALKQHGTRTENGPKLAALGLPAEAVTDPYNGSPIKLKQVKGEWLIYCVGPDLKDDGGQLERNADIGLGPSQR